MGTHAGGSLKEGDITPAKVDYPQAGKRVSMIFLTSAEEIVTCGHGTNNMDDLVPIPKPVWHRRLAGVIIGFWDKLLF